MNTTEFCHNCGKQEIMCECAHGPILDSQYELEEATIATEEVVDGNNVESLDDSVVMHKGIKIIVICDYDDVFVNRVKAAIDLAIETSVSIHNLIEVEAGPYRPYCMSFDKSDDKVSLDFYAANRVFGFQHTINDILTSISKN